MDMSPVGLWPRGTRGRNGRKKKGIKSGLIHRLWQRPREAGGLRPVEVPSHSGFTNVEAPCDLSVAKLGLMFEAQDFKGDVPSPNLAHG